MYTFFIPYVYDINDMNLIFCIYFTKFTSYIRQTVDEYIYFLNCDAINMYVCVSVMYASFLAIVLNIDFKSVNKRCIIFIYL